MNENIKIVFLGSAWLRLNTCSNLHKFNKKSDQVEKSNWFDFVITSISETWFFGCNYLIDLIFTVESLTTFNDVKLSVSACIHNVWAACLIENMNVLIWTKNRTLKTGHELAQSSFAVVDIPYLQPASHSSDIRKVEPYIKMSRSWKCFKNA